MKGLAIMQPALDGSKLEIPSKLYRIGELVRYTPFSRQTIHNYTIMGLISETEWTQGGHRLYDESVFERLSRIIQLKRSKTLSEIRQILSKEQTGLEASPSPHKGDMTDRKMGFTSHSAESTKPQSDP